jgi:GTP-binding protein EngB required for normal cell division
MDAKCIVVEQNLELLNEHQRLRLRVTFEHIDSLLADVDHILAESASYSPFNRYGADTTPIQKRVAHDYVQRIRIAMARIMKDQQIPFGKQHCGSRRAANTALHYAAVAVEELHSNRMRGYGQISDAGHNLLEAIKTELHLLISKLQTYLAQTSNADLQVCIERLQKVSDVTVLEDLGRIITRHGLVEYREALAIIIDRMENKVFEIGVFGRISSGKSSLLNYLLGDCYLPVGVTPVTAVPTRISYGPLAVVGIEFVDNPPETVGCPELWEYATEQGNPGNAKHVTKIHLRLPAPRLQEGIAFVDMPGFGSLATSGPAETLAYLPGCDLGLLVVDASLGISGEDVAVVEALYRAGGSVMILISKADLFNGTERMQLIEYVTRELEHELGMMSQIFPVSVVGESSTLCDTWFKEHLQPMLKSSQHSATAANSRKIAALRNAVIATLKARLTTGEKFVSNEESSNKGLLKAFGEVEESFDKVLQKSFELGRGIADQKSLILKVAVDKIAAEWRDRSGVDSPQILVATTNELLAHPIAQVEEEYNRIRNQALRALETAEKAFPHGLSLELPRASGMPPLDAASLARKLQANRPALTTFLTLPLVKWQLQRQLHKQLFSDLGDYLDVYAKQLRSWLRESVEVLKKSFEPAADIYRLRLQSGEIPITQDPQQTVADLDRLKANL